MGLFMGFTFIRLNRSSLEQKIRNRKMSEKTESDDMKSQETQLRSKYGNIEKRSGQHLLMKQLAGKKQYFDSGDYNMQLRKGMTTKAPLAAIPNKVPWQKAEQLRAQHSVDKTSPQPKQMTKPRKSMDNAQN